MSYLSAETRYPLQEIGCLFVQAMSQTLVQVEFAVGNPFCNLDVLAGSDDDVVRTP